MLREKLSTAWNGNAIRRNWKSQLKTGCATPSNVLSVTARQKPNLPRSHSGPVDRHEYPAPIGCPPRKARRPWLSESNLNQESAMLSKCLNPLCSAPFRYLHEGRVFNIDLVSPDHAQEGSRFHHIEHYWLCSSCALHFKVVVEHGQVF